MRRLQKIFGKSKEKLKHGTLNPGTAPAATGTTPVDGAENSQSQQTHGPDRDDSQAGNIAATPAVNSNEATPTLKSDTKASYGLNPIEPPEVDGERPATDTNFPVDIVAIHGITGGAFTTFTTPKGVFWLQEFLPSDLPGSRIFSFGYDAGVFFTKGEGTLNTFARALLENLRMRRAGPNARRPLIFICHSMGGLVAKRAIVMARLDDLFNDIINSCRGIVFLSTPHRGSDVTTLPKLLASIANVSTPFLSRFIGTSRSDLIKMLEKDSKELHQLSEDFVNRLFHIKVASCVEELKTPPADKRIVDNKTGTVGCPGERIIPMQGCNHSTVCTFEERDNNYDLVMGVIKEWCENPGNELGGPELGRKTRVGLTHAEQQFVERLPGHNIGIFLDGQEQPQPGSCNWIPENENFVKFLSSNDKHVFHLVGEPGSGKSTAAAWLFQASNSWASNMYRLLFSFHGKPSAPDAWSSLLYQLLHLDATSTAAVHGALEGEEQRSRWKSERSSSDPWTFLRLRDVFKSTVGQLPATLPMLYIIDAVDECDETLPSFLGSVVDILQARPSSKVKFIFLSRPTSSSSMDRLFEPVGGTVRIMMNENSAHIENVQRYIRTKVEDLLIVRPGLAELRQEIISELERRSAGIYLLASLNLKSLSTAVATPDEIRAVIRTLPGDLQAIYSHALDKVPPAYRLRTAALLLWVAFSVRPLGEWELSTAVGMTCLKRPLKDYRDLKNQVSLSIMEETGIRELVGPVLRVTSGNIVLLVHSSARQYLLSLAPGTSGSEDPGDHDWVWGSVMVHYGFNSHSVGAMASRVLSSNCQHLIALPFLTNTSELTPDPTKVAGSDFGIRSLLKYAIETLPDHVRQAASEEDTHALFATFLQSDNGGAWMRQFWMLRDPTQRYKLFSPLEFCCALGLVEAVKKLLSLSRYPTRALGDIEDVRRAEAAATELLTAADLAAMFGNVEILQFLCDDMQTPVDSNRLIPLTAWKATPSGWIHIGAEFGYDVPVPAEGTKGQDVENARNRAEESLSAYHPLHTATAYGHANVAEFLISKGANIAREDENGKWPIEIAMENGIGSLVQLLFRHHQEFSDDFIRLIRHIADTENTMKIDFLLELDPKLKSNGVHFTAMFGEYSGSMLHLAAADGNLVVYKYLVPMCETKDSAGRQAIHYAAASGQDVFLQTILADGVAHSADTDASGRNALFYATLGTSCYDIRKLTMFPEREKVISALLVDTTETLRDSLISSALRSLAEFEPSRSGYYGHGPGLETCVMTLRSKVPGLFTLDGGFLHAAFRSDFFPLGLALDLARDINEVDNRGQTALHVAATNERKWGSWHKKFAETVNDIDKRDNDGCTALRLAIDSAKTSAADLQPRIEILLDHGAQIDSRDSRGMTVISAAAEFLERGELWVQTYPPGLGDGLLALLLSRSPDGANGISYEVLPSLVYALENSKAQRDLASLMRAMSAEQRSYWVMRFEPKRVTQEVLFACQDWAPKSLYAVASRLDTTQLEKSCAQAFLEKSRIIAQLCLPRLSRRLRDASWLRWLGAHQYLLRAVQNGDKETIKTFLKIMMGDVNTIIQSGQTMLSIAAENGHAELVGYLLSHNADVSIPDGEGKTALFWAARENRLDAVMLLVEAGAQITPRDINITKEMELKGMNRKEVRTYLENTIS